MNNLPDDSLTLLWLFLINLVFISHLILLTKLLGNSKSIKKIFLIPIFIISYLALIFLKFKYQLLVYFLIMFLIIKVLFNKDLKETLFILELESFLYFLATIILLIINKIFPFDIYMIKNTPYEFIVIPILVLIIFIPLKSVYKKLVNLFKTDLNIISKIILIIDLISLIIGIYSLSIINFKITNLVLVLVILVIILGFSALVIKYNIVNTKLIKKYKVLEQYVEKTADLVEKYSANIHRYKNHLITLKGYIKNNNDKALTYINSLLNDYKKEDYDWLIKINYIKEDSIRYLTYYKLAKAEEANLKVIVDISANIKNIDYDKFKINEISIINDILGEYFDNAIYASLESSLKELNFMVYIEKKKLIFLISNTYKGNIDLSLIEKNGYTTKGIEHGYGLYDIGKRLTNNKKISYSYELLDNYFIVKLIVNL